MGIGMCIVLDGLARYRMDATLKHHEMSGHCGDPVADPKPDKDGEWVKLSDCYAALVPIRSNAQENHALSALEALLHSWRSDPGTQMSGILDDLDAALVPLRAQLSAQKPDKSALPGWSGE